jgi:hypothetical protein
VSYRCQLCPAVVPSGRTRRVHRVLRPDGNIEREIPVCSDCDLLLARGLSVAEVVKRRKPPDPEAPVLVTAPRPKVVDLGTPAPKVAAPTTAKVLEKWQGKANGNLTVKTPQRPPKK